MAASLDQLFLGRSNRHESRVTDMRVGSSSGSSRGTSTPSPACRTLPRRVLLAGDLSRRHLTHAPTHTLHQP